MSNFITLEDCGQISILTVARPEARNALSCEVLSELSQTIKELHKNDSLRALIITGAGDKAFCAGADLKERQGMTEKETLAFVTKIQKTFQETATLPMPTIAAMTGDAFGGGLELALACDIRVLSLDATVGLTECAWGIIPGAGGTQRLPRLVGLSRAADLIFSARRIGASEAFSMGLVNYLAKDADGTRKMASDLAERIAANAPLAVRAAKEALLASQELSMSDGLVTELASYHEIIETDDRKEGLKSFQEKRPARFRGC